MKLYQVHQKLISNPLPDPVSVIHAQLDSLNIDVPNGDIAITAGSRGIANIATMTKAVGDWLKSKGAHPFITPCMGSHNGATADGQRSMIESFGITEKAMQMEIRAGMDVVKLATVSSGDVFIDRICHEADGVVVLNRIKLHTCFGGPVQSGLMKMMVVGMGNVQSAETFHSCPTSRMPDMIKEMAGIILDSGQILAGIGILEDGYDQTAEIVALRAGDIMTKEPLLLEKHKEYFPRLPVDELKILVINEIGKTFSGTCIDPNVIGYRGIKDFEDVEKPNISFIAALNLVETSQGNALGVGLADFVTQRLRDRIDEKKTFINAFTTGEMSRAKIPATLADDEELIQKLEERLGSARWMFIPNTLHLETLYITQDLVDDIKANPLCEVMDEPVELTFRGGRHQLSFDACWAL